MRATIEKRRHIFMEREAKLPSDRVRYDQVT